MKGQSTRMKGMKGQSTRNERIDIRNGRTIMSMLIIVKLYNVFMI